MSSCENTPNSSYTEKKALHIPSGYSILMCYYFDKTLNEQKYYRGKHCIQKASKDILSILYRLINYEQKGMIPLTDDEKALHDNQNVFFLCKKEFCVDKSN